MTELPAELEIVPEDLGGVYTNDCSITRALKRAGVVIDKQDGYYVTGYGFVRNSDRKIETVGRYRWKEQDEEFSYSTVNQTGTLIFTETPEWRRLL